VGVVGLVGVVGVVGTVGWAEGGVGAADALWARAVGGEVIGLSRAAMTTRDAPMDLSRANLAVARIVCDGERSMGDCCRAWRTGGITQFDVGG
jgi:hypothetical protein